MVKRTVLYAEGGKVLTNGDIYGKQIFLAEGDDGSAFHEISEDEYNAIIEVESPLENEEVENQPVDEEINMPTVGEENNEDFGSGDFYS